MAALFVTRRCWCKNLSFGGRERITSISRRSLFRKEEPMIQRMNFVGFAAFVCVLMLPRPCGWIQRSSAYCAHRCLNLTMPCQQ